MSVGTNLSPLATQSCTPKFSLRKGLYIFPLLNMIHLQFTISNVKISPCTLSNTISSLSSSFASVLPTHGTPQGLWPPELPAFPVSYQWREIFKHFSSFGSTMKKAEREFYRLSLYMHNEVLFTLSLQWKKMKCSKVGSHPTLLSKSPALPLQKMRRLLSKLWSVSHSASPSLSTDDRRNLLTQFRHDIFYRKMKSGKKKAI